MKKIINHDRGGTYVLCAWDTCEKSGYEAYKCVEHDYTPEGQRRYGDRLLTYVFCSERHKQYFIHSIRRAGDLPPGYRQSIVLVRSDELVGRAWSARALGHPPYPTPWV